MEAPTLMLALVARATLRIYDGRSHVGDGHATVYRRELQTNTAFRRGRQTIVNARLGFLERIGHGKYVEWVRNEEQGGYYEIK